MHPSAIVLAVITYADRVLLVWRANPAEGEPRWIFPGGKIDAGETPKAAVIREVREETGLALTTLRPLGTRQHAITGYQAHYFHAPLAEAPAPLALSPRELSDGVWLTRKEALERLGPSLAPVVRQLLNGDEPRNEASDNADR
jgi:8-oxo-dGTP diphosphatase